MSRIVVVLGREPEVDMDAFVKRAWQENLELVILTLGVLPLSAGQQRACDVALEAAGRGLIWLEERVVYDPAGVGAAVRADDRVHLAVSALEQKRIEFASRRGGAEPPLAAGKND